MKVIGVVLGAALPIVSYVMISLVRSGGALLSAGVIKPAEIGLDPHLIPKQIAVRLFPDFDTNKVTIWWIEAGRGQLAEIPVATIAHYRGHETPALHDLRMGERAECAAVCWYIQNIGSPLPETVVQRLKSEPANEIFIQYFDRDEKVPETCEAEKILDPICMRPVSVREVRRKLKTSAPYYFMRRYLQSQFYLFIERPR